MWPLIPLWFNLRFFNHTMLSSVSGSVILWTNRRESIVKQLEMELSHERGLAETMVADMVSLEHHNHN